MLSITVDSTAAYIYSVWRQVYVGWNHCFLVQIIAGPFQQLNYFRSQWAFPCGVHPYKQWRPIGVILITLKLVPCRYQLRHILAEAQLQQVALGCITISHKIEEVHWCLLAPLFIKLNLPIMAFRTYREDILWTLPDCCIALGQSILATGFSSHG